MAMTAAVKDELSRLSVTKPCCRKAEVSSLLRFAGGLHIAAGKVVIEVELDTSQSARRLKKDIADIYGHDSDLAVLSSSGLRKGSRYVVRVIEAGDALARQTGLIDSNGRPVRGLPPQVVAANICDAEAAWRGAFVAHGSLTEPGRSSSLEITCPGPEAALALVGAARRLGITAKAREVRATANRLANFDDANLRRSARAAVAAAARVQRAMEILGPQIPDHLKEAGELRISHGQASLEELGSLASPPMTKDAIAGRIRRLLAMADKRAGELGIPDTEAGLSPDLLN